MDLRAFRGSRFGFFFVLANIFNRKSLTTKDKRLTKEFTVYFVDLRALRGSRFRFFFLEL